MTEPPCGFVAPTAASPRAPRHLKYVEAVLCIGFVPAFLVWIHPSAPGPFVPGATHRSPAIDTLLPTPDVRLRPAVGQLTEVFATLTHPFLIFGLTVAGVAYVYTVRIRHLSVSLAIATAGIPTQYLTALYLARPAPGSTFPNFIAAFEYSYPNAHVTVMTLASWVLATPARAHHRSTMVATDIVLGYAAVAVTAIS